MSVFVKNQPTERTPWTYRGRMDVTYEWRGTFENDDLNRLHAEAFEHRVLDDDWVAQVDRHSLGWVCAYLGSELVGFVNVAWDGGVHAFVLDTMVANQAATTRASASAWSRRPFLAHGRPTANGSMSTSTTTSEISTSTDAVLRRQTRDSSSYDCR